MDKPKEKYFATYVCPLCNEKFSVGEGINEKPKPSLEYLFFALYAYSKISDKVVHECRDGSTGVAYFAGFRREEKSEI